MKTLKKIIIIISGTFALNACSLKPISSQYDYQKNKATEVDLNTLGNGRILIYNGATSLYKIDNSSRLNMWLNKKPMGQFSHDEYVIIELEKGIYDFDLLHIDLFKFKSTHNVLIDESTKVIRIKPNLMSNKLTITNQLPSKFDKFNYVERK